MTSIEINIESRKNALKLTNLLWRLKIAFSVYDGTELKVTRLKSDVEYLNVSLSRALSQGEDITLKSLADEIVSMLQMSGTTGRNVATVLFVDSKKKDLINSEFSSQPEVKVNAFLPNVLGHFSRYKRPMLAAMSVVAVSVLINFLWPTNSALNSNGIRVEKKVDVIVSNAMATSSPFEVDNSHVVNGMQNLTAGVEYKRQQGGGTTYHASQMLMRLHGSNTVGENLAPKLIVSYLKTLGAESISIIRSENNIEKTIEARLPSRGWVAIEVHAHGSSTAFKDLKAGSTDMGMSSRKIKTKEVDMLKSKLGDMTLKTNEHVVGLDGLAIIVHPSNPINDLTTEQVARLFSGKIKNWSELGMSQGKVNIYARDNNSGTWDTFKNLVLKKYNRKLSTIAGRFESSSELSDLVAKDLNAIGFIGLPYVRQSKLLAIADSESTRAILPTRFTVGTEDYPLARRLYLYTPEKQTSFMRNWVNYALSEHGQDVVRKIGFISQNIYESKPKISGAVPEKYKEMIADATRLSLNFRFRLGSKNLDNKSIRDISRLTDYMSKNRDKQLILFGFADNIGNEVNNERLSIKRAKMIEVKLQRYGIFAQQVAGFGEQMAVASNDTAAGREKNRRVEAWVY